MMRLSGVLGFITNSSSAIYHFPAELLEHPTVKLLLETYGVKDGYVGSYLWSRNTCETLAITRDQKERVIKDLDSINGDGEPGYIITPPAVNLDDSQIVLIYGDEYPGLTSELCHIMRQAAEELGLTYSGDEYN